MKESLFSHLALKFASSPENIATEALCYILNKSKTAVKVLNSILIPTGVTLTDNLSFETQVLDEEEDQAIPDLAGINPETDAPEVIFEVKFWAGLTENQPVTYLKRSQKKGGKILLFLCPMKRVNTLTFELERRCLESKIIEQSKKVVEDGFISIDLENHSVMGIISWGILLSRIRKAIEAEGNISVLADIIELQGLAERVEETAFIPIRSEELTGYTANRIIQYCNLVDELTQKLVTSNVASTKALRATPLREGYGKYLYIHNHGCMIQFNALHWRDILPTPLWISLQWVENKVWIFPTEAKRALSFLEYENPPRLYATSRVVLIPLFIPYGLEKEGCLENLMGQLKPIIDIMADVHQKTLQMK